MYNTMKTVNLLVIIVGNTKQFYLILLGATTPGQSGPGSNGNEVVLCIPQSSSIIVASSSDGLVLYPGHSLGESYPSAEIQSVYSAAPADWVIVAEGWVTHTP